MVEKRKEQQSILWKFMEKFALTFFSFLCSMVLARLVSPTDYGNYAIVSSVVLVAATVVTNNIINLIVKEKEVNDVKINTIFIYNLGISVALTTILWGVSVVLYVLKIEKLPLLLFIQSINIIVLALQSVFMAILVKQMKFKKIAFSALISGIISFVVAIMIAAQGAGIFALMAQYLVNNVMLVIVLYFQSNYKQALLFSKSYILENLSFLFSVIFADMTQLVSRTFQNILVQQTSSSQVLGFYDKGYSLSKTCSDLFYETANTVTFPMLSEKQDNCEHMRSVMRSVLYLFTLLCIPVIFLFFVFGEEIIIFLFSSVWKESAYYFKIFFLIYCLVSLNTVASQVLIIKNKYKDYRNITMFYNLVTVLIMIFIFQQGATFIPVVMLLVTIIQITTTLYCTKNLIDYGLLQYLESCKILYLFVIICSIQYCLFLFGGSLLLRIVYCLVCLSSYCIILWKCDRTNIVNAYHQLIKK